MRPFPIDAYYRKNTVRPLGYHEAGHYVLARVLGFKTGSLKLKMLDLNGAHIGGSVSEPVRALLTISDVVRCLEDRVIVLFGGSLAQSLSNGKVDTDAAVAILDKGGAVDYAKAREFVHLIRNIRYPHSNTNEEIQNGLDEICNGLWNRAVVLVEKDHELICGLGDRLASELKETQQEFELTETELETLRNIRERFKDEEDKF